MVMIIGLNQCETSAIEFASDTGFEKAIARDGPDKSANGTTGNRRLPSERDTGEVGKLTDDGILLRHDQSERVDLLLKRGIILSQVVESVAELNDLLSHGDVRLVRRTCRTDQGENERGRGAWHRLSSSIDGSGQINKQQAMQQCDGSRVAMVLGGCRVIVCCARR
jgi:hypothetical protein